MARRLQIKLSLLLYGAISLVVAASVVPVYWISQSGGRAATAAVIDHLRAANGANVGTAVSSFFRHPMNVLAGNHRYLSLGLVDADSPDALARFFAAEIAGEPSFTYISYGSAQGWYAAGHRDPDTDQVLIALCRRAGEPIITYTINSDGSPNREVSRSGPFDPRLRPWFQSGRDAAGMTWGPVYKYALHQDLGVSVVEALHAPDGEIRGILAVDFALKRLTGYLRELPLGAEGVSAVLESDGSIVACNFLDAPFVLDSTGIIRRTAATSGSPVLATAWEHIAESPEGVTSGSFPISLPDGPVLVDWRILERGGGGRLTVLTALPSAPFYAAFDATARGSLVSVAVVLALTGFGGLLMARRLMSSIRRLGDYAARLAAGGTVAGGGDTRIIEFAELGRRFAGMAGEIAGYRDRLEQAVAESTAEVRELRNRMAQAAFGAAGAAHEVRGPIGNSLLAVTRLSELATGLQRDFDAKKITVSGMAAFLADCAETTSIIQSNLERSAEISRNFQAVAAGQLDGQPRRILLQEYLNQLLFTLSPSLRQAGVTVVRDWGPPVALEIDPGLLAHIVSNLVNNSVAHAFPLDWTGPREIRFALRRDDSGIHLDYADSGAGMSAEVLDRMFEPLFSTGTGGDHSGLGMAIVKRLVEQKTGGSISAASVPGQGSRFTVSFPASLAAEI